MSHNCSLRAVCVDVAGAGAVAKLVNGVVDCHRARELRVRHRPVVHRVAGSAIRLKGWKLPGHHLRICRVASAAFERHTVIGIFRGHVPVVYRGPRPCPVARLAGQRGDEVSRPFAFGRGAVVTARACRRDAAVIHARALERHCTFVTGLTGRSCDDVIGRLPGCRNAIMAACAIADDAGVIHADERKTRRASVTQLAGRVGRDVPLRFASCCNSVVATCAAACDSGMVEFCVYTVSSSSCSRRGDRPARNTHWSIRP